MISMSFVFWIFVSLAAVNGALRGWAKELLVTFSVILGLFIITVLETFVVFVYPFLKAGGPTEFWSRVALILLLAFFGYQTPNLRMLAKGAAREKLQDSLLGIVLGGVNGYLIVGSIWSFLNKPEIYYPFAGVMIPPTDPGSQQILSLMPPLLLSSPGIYFAVAIAFTFVVIVFV